MEIWLAVILYVLPLESYHKAGVDIEDWLMQNSAHLPFGETEVQLIVNQLAKGLGIVETTSCGRVLDAVAAVLGICYHAQL